VKLYQVTNYLDINEWFLCKRKARKRFDELLMGDYSECQGRLRSLEVVRTTTLMSPTQALVNQLNSQGWADSIETIVKVTP
jgi:hypothetical protein